MVACIAEAVIAPDLMRLCERQQGCRRDFYIAAIMKVGAGETLDRAQVGAPANQIVGRDGAFGARLRVTNSSSLIISAEAGGPINTTPPSPP